MTEAEKARKALEAVIAEANTYRDAYAAAVQIMSPYLQSGGEFAHLLKIGDGMLTKGPAALAGEIHRLKAQNVDLANVLDEILNYRGGATNALLDPYVVERANAIMASARGAK